MNLYKITSQALVYIAILSMLLGPVAEAKAQAGLASQVGLKATSTIQGKGLASLKELNANALLGGNKAKGNKTQKVTIEKTDEELLSKLSQDIYWQLKEWQQSKTNQLLDQAEKQTLTQWLAQLNTLQVKVNKNLDKLTS